MSRLVGLRRHWTLDPDVVQLNHGGFGAAPSWVLAEQQRYRSLMERNPTDFFVRRLPDLLTEARERLAAFLGCDPAGTVLVGNATAGVATALEAVRVSLRLGPGDELLTTDHCYGAVRQQLARLAAATGADVSVAPLPMPARTAEELSAAVLSRLSDRTRAVVIDQVTSPTGIVLPVRQIAAACRDRGVVTVVDGAHAPGMLALDVGGLGVDYWTGNLHKWVCAPKSAAVLWAAPEWREWLRPLVASHFFADGLQPAFDWTGTFDPSPVLAAVTAVEFFTALGWDEVRAANRSMAAAGARLVADALGTDVPVADELAGSMRVVTLPEPLDRELGREVERRLLVEHGIEVPLTVVDAARWVRLSAQVYNTAEDYAALATALPKALAAVRSS